MEKEKRWIVKAEELSVNASDVERISSTLGINRYVAALLYNRGFTTPE